MQSATQQTLSDLVSEHVTALIRESAAVNRHSRRGGHISAADETDTLANSSGQQQQKRRRLIHHDDINMALQWRGSEKLYVGGISSVLPPPQTQSHPDDAEEKYNKKSSTANNNKRPKNALTQLLQNTTSTATVSSLLKASHVPRVDLNAYLQSELAVRPPSELAMTLHWLAVDGVCPMIPMNEVWNHTHHQGGIATTDAGAVGGLDPFAAILEEEDDDEDFDNSTSSRKKQYEESSIRIRELQQRLLSEELQLYFSRVTSTIEHSTDFSEIETVFHGIRSDCGIQELVPFLSRFVASGLMNKKRLQNTEYCSRLIKVFDAMLSNPNLHLDLHLHQMFSPVGTCIVAKKLCNDPVTEDHWSLREDAARCLVKACDIYGVQYTTMKPRIIKLLTQQALRGDRPLATQYGGIVGISLFGPRAIDAFLLPVAKEYWECWEEELKKNAAVMNPNDDYFGAKKKTKDVVAREYELRMCQQALLDAVAIFMRGVNPAEQAKRVDIESFVDVFGERLIPMQAEVTEYVSAII